MATRKSTPRSRVPAGTATPRAAVKRAVAGPTKVAPPAPASSSPALAAKPKQKLMRDSFTIPKGEYAVLLQLKQRAVQLTRPAKKSEILLAGISALNTMPDNAYLAALDAVPSLKTGRPMNAKPAPRKVAAKKS